MDVTALEYPPLSDGLGMYIDRPRKCSISSFTQLSSSLRTVHHGGQRHSVGTRHRRLLYALRSHQHMACLLTLTITSSS